MSPEILLLGFVLAALGGGMAAWLLHRHPGLIALLAVVAIPAAVFWVSAADNSGREPVEPVERTVWSIVLVAGWLIGLGVIATYVRARDDNVHWDRR